MNRKSHKTIFSKRLGCLVAVGEHATSQGKAQGASGAMGLSWAQFVGLLSAGFAAVSLAWAQPANNALPTGGQVAQGGASISTNGANMNIQQTTARAVVNWQSFDIGKDARVHIQQPGADSVMLNRVTSANPSQIFGQLNANGQVVLVNPNGVLFGRDGSVTATSFTASTLGISDANFMAGNMQFERNGSTAGVVNQGSIKTTGGYVALLGASVSNEGKIETSGGAVYLAAAETVKVPLSGSGRIKLELTPAQINARVSNAKEGTIVTHGGQVYMQAAALNNAVASIVQSGSIDTTGRQGGAVHVLADGGQIRVDGAITANSTGNDGQGRKLAGGELYIGRDKDTNVLAAVGDASGARLESEGGFVETSGKFLKVDGTRVRAAQWLLDPDNIDITGDATNPAAGYTKVKASDIVANLNQGTSVTVSTAVGVTPSSIAYTGGSGMDGNILVSVPIATNVMNGFSPTLSLLADNGINIASTAGISDAAGNGQLNVELNAKGRAVNLNTGSSGLTVSGAIHIEGSLNMKGHNSRSGGDFGNLRSAIVVNSIANANTLKANSINMVGVSDGIYSVENHINNFGYGAGYGVLLYGSLEATHNIDIAGWTRSNGDGVRVANQVKSTHGNIDILGAIQSSPAGVHINGKLSAQAGTVTLTGASSVRMPGSFFTNVNKNEILTGTTNLGGADQGIYVNNATIEGANVIFQTPANPIASPRIGVQIQGTSKVSATSELKFDVQSTSTTAAATRLYGSSSYSAATIDIRSDTFDLVSSSATTPLSASGSVQIAPRTPGLPIQLGASDKLTATRTLGLSQAELDQIAAGSLNIGHSSAGAMTVSGTITTKDTTGHLQLLTGGNLSINAALQAGTSGTKNLTLNLAGSGTANQTASLKAGALELLGANASYTLTHISNDAATLAANVQSMRYVDASALTVGSVNFTSGITASGTIAVGTQSGDLSVSQAVSTTDTTDSAIVFNAGVSTTAGTATGGDIQLGGTYSFTTGAGGRTTLFTGNTSNTHLTNLVGSGSGRFRYNSDESTVSYSAALGSGLYAIYRGAPALSVALNAQNKTYDGLAHIGGNGFVTSGTLLNGDTDAGVTVVYSGSSQGARDAGTYSLLGSATSSLGYTLNTSGSTLTINKAPLMVTASSVTKTYDGALSASGVGVVGVLAGAAAGEVVNSQGSQAFLDKNAGRGKTVRASGVTIKDSASQDVTANYDISYVDNTSSVINKAPLMASLQGTVEKVYDGTTSAVVSTSNFHVTGWVSGEGAAVGQTLASYADKNVSANSGSGVVTAMLSETHFVAQAGTNLANYHLPAQASGAVGKITPAPLTIKVNDSAIFVTQNASAAPQMGYAYTGFVGTENASTALSFEPTALHRSYLGTNPFPLLGQHNGVLGMSATPTALDGNYTVSLQNGNLNVIPVDKLLVTIQSQSDTYGNRTLATAGQASQVVAQYCVLSGGACNAVSSLNMTSGPGNLWRGTDNTGSSVQFETSVPTDGHLSQGGYLNVGNYTYGIRNVVLDSPGNFLQGAVPNGGILTIDRLALTPALGAATKVYDGTRTIPSASLRLPGVLPQDAVGLTGVGQFAQRHTGTGLSYTISHMALEGADRNNYALLGGVTSYSGNDGTITPALLRITSSDVVKTYDGTVAAQGTAVVTGGTQLFGDDALTGGQFSFASRDAGVGNRRVRVSGVVVNDGNGGGNYSVVYEDNTTSTIQQASATVTGTPTRVPYNGQMQVQDAPVTSGFLAGDEVFVTGLARGRDSGTYRSSLGLTGRDASNYDVRFVDAELVIAGDAVPGQTVYPAQSMQLPPAPKSGGSVVLAVAQPAVAAVQPSAPAACSAQDTASCSCEDTAMSDVQICMAPSGRSLQSSELLQQPRETDI